MEISIASEFVGVGNIERVAAVVKLVKEQLQKLPVPLRPGVVRIVPSVHGNDDAVEFRYRGEFVICLGVSQQEGVLVIHHLQTLVMGNYWPAGDEANLCIGKELTPVRVVDALLIMEENAQWNFDRRIQESQARVEALQESKRQLREFERSPLDI